MTIPEQAGKVATSAIDAFRAQPGLLFLTLVNIAFLAFVYFVGMLVLSAYREDQAKVHERYQTALTILNRCIEVGLSGLEEQHTAPAPDDDEDRR